MKKLLFVLLCIGGTVIQAEEATTKQVLFGTTDKPVASGSYTYELEIEFPAGTGRSPEKIQLAVSNPDIRRGETPFVLVEVQKDWLHRLRSGKGYIKSITIEKAGALTTEARDSLNLRQELSSDEIALINNVIDQYEVNPSTGRPDVGKPMLTFMVKEVGEKFSISAHMGDPTKK